MDLQAYTLSHDEMINNYIKENYGEVPRLRGVRFMKVEEKWDTITAYVVGDELTAFEMKLGELTDDERTIILKGCLINYYRG